jgi:ATP-dependent DNA helicase 2 subunit 1
MVYQQLRTINAEEMKKVIKLVEAAQEQYEVQTEDEDTQTIQPQVLSDTFPAAEETAELNIADVLVTCNFLFRDAWVASRWSLYRGIDNSGTKLAGNKRVFMITDNDEPAGSTSTRDPARTVYGVGRSAISRPVLPGRIC